MDKKLNILVIGVGGNVSIGILKAIRKSTIDRAFIYGACVQEKAAGFALSDAALICPYADSEDFLPWLKKTEQNFLIDVVVSGVEEVNYVLSGLKKDVNSPLYLVAERDNISTFSDKLKTSEWLESNGLNFPFTVDLDKVTDVTMVSSALAFPCVVKPKLGKGSKDVCVVDCLQGLEPFIVKGGYVAQQLIGDSASEFTCGVYKSKFGYTEVVVMQRELRNGSTSVAEVVFDSEIEKYCRAIAEKCQTSSPFNVQLRMCKVSNQPYCFEINMRLSGTTAVRHAFGFQDCHAWIVEQFHDIECSDLFDVRAGVAVRYEEEVFFDKASLRTLSSHRATSLKEVLLK